MLHICTVFYRVIVDNGRGLQGMDCRTLNALNIKLKCICNNGIAHDLSCCVSCGSGYVFEQAW